MTSGPFHHHFADKKACFEAVYPAVEQDFFDYIEASWKGNADQWARTVAGIEAFFDACVSHDVRQIVLIDGPPQPYATASPMNPPQEVSSRLWSSTRLSRSLTPS